MLGVSDPEGHGLLRRSIGVCQHECVSVSVSEAEMSVSMSVCQCASPTVCVCVCMHAWVCIKVGNDNFRLEFSQLGRENEERGRELKMNTSEANLVLFLENSYPVN